MGIYQIWQTVAVVGLTIGLLSGCAESNTSTASIYDMKVNQRTNPIGIDEEVFFSWKLQDTQQNQYQQAYQILVSNSQKELKKGQYVWDSGKMMTDVSVAIPYAGNILEPEEDYFWMVKVWDKDGKLATSETASFEMGKLGNEWENTSWITFENAETAVDNDGINNFDVSYQLKMERTSAGFMWGGRQGKYAEHYVWALDARDEKLQLVISKRDNENVLEEEKMILEEYDSESFLASMHEIKICVRGNVVSTYLDGKVINEKKLTEETQLHNIGLWVARGDRNAWYDNLMVCDDTGKIWYEEDFGKEVDTIFSPYYLKVEDGWGRVDAGYIVAPGYEEPAPMFRKQFDVTDKAVEKARIYVTALGIYDLYVNGQDICEEYAAPGQSVYTQEVYYRTYDVTSIIQSGQNAIGVILGHGRYDRAKEDWGEQLALCAQLVIEYEDGTRQVIGTDETWLTYANGPIRSNDLFAGEYYDANYEVNGWADVNCEEATWQQAVLYTGNDLKKKAAIDAGVVCVETISPISMQNPEEGVYVYDFGQNFNGVCSVRLNGKAGQTVIMRHAEVQNSEMLARPDDEMGTIWTRNLLAADNTDYYTFSQDGEAIYEPTFVYRGFRYLQITGVDEAPKLEDVQGLVLSTDNERTGYFECSDENINRLYDSIYWTQLSNYVDIPTDCPQRDERLGWTGDAQVFASTGAMNAEIANFMDKYIDALRVSQNEDGSYPQIAPHVSTVGGANGWCDAGIILVWEMYQQYGNQQIIEKNLEAMCKYIDYLVATSENYIRKHENYSDFNGVNAPAHDYCNTAQCAYVSKLLYQMCDVIEEQTLAEKYKEIYEAYLTAWQNAFLGEDGAIGEWLQAEYTLGLAYGLYPENLGANGAQKLQISVEASNHHVSTGYVATPHLLQVLCDYGYVESAYNLIQQTGYPSWNNMLEMGATTITENWGVLSLTQNGLIDITGSLNHLALGSVGRWMYTDILGINRDENQVAYKHFYLEPQVGGNLTFARGSYDSMYGTIESSWEVIDDQIKFRFVIPANTSATITLPDEAYQQLELGSGTYEFVVNK